jgi:ABC-type Fe3+-hydroxamate transport system substrate-binding protein
MFTTGISPHTDQLNREITFPDIPKRIISVVPSQTELLFDLGLDKQIVGVTKFCIHPASKVKVVQKIGGTKQLDIEKIKSLQPDLVIANKEENERSQIEELMRLYPVWISDISNLDEAVDMINRVGALTGTSGAATLLSPQILKNFNELAFPQRGRRTAYFIWRKPYMIAGKGTFIDDMLQRCGFINAFDRERYPEITAEDLSIADPEVVLLSSEPYPFKQKHMDEIRGILPNAIIKLVDGEIFSWYGSRLLHARQYFEGLIASLI